jgi:hypothetical protein
MPIYRIRIKGHLDQRWADWFGGLTISNEPNGEAVVAGQIPDQAALHGVLVKLRDLGLPLVALCQVMHERPCSEPSATGG